MSGLRVNMDKRKFFSRLEYALSLLWNILLIAADGDCRISLPLAYLGLVLGSYFVQKSLRNSILERVEKCLAGKKASLHI